MSCGQTKEIGVSFLISDVLAWLGLEATGFGLALGGFGFWDPQAKPYALAWLWLGFGLRGGCVINLAYCRKSSLELQGLM
jgi:hypothetical protein